MDDSKDYLMLDDEVQRVDDGSFFSFFCCFYLFAVLLAFVHKICRMNYLCGH